MDDALILKGLAPHAVLYNVFLQVLKESGSSAFFVIMKLWCGIHLSMQSTVSAYLWVFSAFCLFIFFHKKHKLEKNQCQKLCHL